MRAINICSSDGQSSSSRSTSTSSSSTTGACSGSLLNPHTAAVAPHAPHGQYRDCPARAEVIKSKGIEQITVDDLVHEITPHGRGELLPVGYR